MVCVTAKENYALEQVESTDTHGPDKYAAAGVTFVTPVPWQLSSAPDRRAFRLAGGCVGDGARGQLLEIRPALHKAQLSGTTASSQDVQRS